jgi:hypothetical protein
MGMRDRGIVTVKCAARIHPRCARWVSLSKKSVGPHHCDPCQGELTIRARQAERRRRRIDATPMPPVGRFARLAAPAKGRPGRHDTFHVLDAFDVSTSKARAACDHHLEINGRAVEPLEKVPARQRCQRIGCVSIWPEMISPVSSRSSSSLSNPRARRGSPARDAASSKLERFNGATKITLQRKLIRCGDRSCEKLHGPYWYGYFKLDGRTRCVYIGRELSPAMRKDRRFAVTKEHLELEAST